MDVFAANVLVLHLEDINWFQPVELVTKEGRRGHINDSLGTHGLAKCYFDRPLRSSDTVLLPLYKRVFPRWAYRAHQTAHALPRTEAAPPFALFA